VTPDSADTPDSVSLNTADSASERPLRFGLIGTGYWARVAHAQALAATPGIEFTAIWGRNPDAARALADEHGATPHTDLDAFLADVDGVAFSVPPDVQSDIAVRAAQAGKHLLLEKPIALTASAAQAMTEAVDQAGVASVVFFTSRFQPNIRAWLADLASIGGWQGGGAIWLASAFIESSPFNTPWRREQGGLWDVGPHAISLLWASLGPVVAVTADPGAGDLAHLVLHHDGGATSTATVTLGAPEAADGFDLYVWGEAGRSQMPQMASSPVTALRVALTELAEVARAGGQRHPCDVHFGRDVLDVLADAQRQIDARRRDGGESQAGA
jgi:predicted dehydrogenase